MKSQKALSILAASFLAICLEPQADTHSPIVTATLQQSPQSACLSRVQAEAEAEKLALKSAQRYCRSSGFGWKAASFKHMGNLDCLHCGGGNYSCGYSNSSLECRKAEPKLTWLGWLSGNP